MPVQRRPTTRDPVQTSSNLLESRPVPSNIRQAFSPIWKLSQILTSLSRLLEWSRFEHAVSTNEVVGRSCATVRFFFFKNSKGYAFSYTCAVRIWNWNWWLSHREQCRYILTDKLNIIPWMLRRLLHGYLFGGRLVHAVFFLGNYFCS